MLSALICWKAFVGCAGVTSATSLSLIHIFRLPETIQVPHEAGGKEYRDHLFVSDATGTAKLKLNGWEADLIAEEEKRQDFVCWIRNPSRASWALCIPYEINGEIKPTYPDFIIVREDEHLGYVIDILEPHLSLIHISSSAERITARQQTPMKDKGTFTMNAQQR